MGLTQRTDSRDEVLPELGVRQFFVRLDESIVDLQVELGVEKRYGVRYRSVPSYHTLLQRSGLSYQHPEGIYRSRPNEATIAEFEAEAEKK